MLKKQTVWLLTMLSLMIVLSVYYMISPGSDDIAFIDDGGVEQTSADPDGLDSEGEIGDIQNLGGDELFTTIRMELQDERSMKKDRLTAVVASSDASPEEKDEALNDIDALEEVSTKESILEETIIKANGYEDVLVRSDEDTIHIHVKTDELSEVEANYIMQMARDEFGEMNVNVNFQPTEPSQGAEDEDDAVSPEDETAPEEDEPEADE